jgi:hypothetical protein
MGHDICLYIAENLHQRSLFESFIRDERFVRGTTTQPSRSVIQSNPHFSTHTNQATTTMDTGSIRPEHETSLNEGELYQPC